MIRWCFCLLFAASHTFSLAAEERWNKEFDWGHITASDDAVHFHVTALPDNGVIRVPRLYNSYEQLYLRGDSNKKTLGFKPEINHWLITLPKGVGEDPVVVMETVGKPRLPQPPDVIGISAAGIFSLPACLATVHGNKLRFEPQPHKNTIGYWADAGDWCEWLVEVPSAGTYEVHLWQGCGTGQGGSEVEIRAGENQLVFTVEDTGHFQNFRERKLGKIHLEAGKQSLQIRPRVKAKKAVMDVRLVVLRKSNS